MVYQITWRDISEEINLIFRFATHKTLFYSEDGSSKMFRNVGNKLPRRRHMTEEVISVVNVEYRKQGKKKKILSFYWKSCKLVQIL
jgi:hypothetical protein